MTEIAKGFYELDPYVRDQFAELAVPEEEIRINEVVAIDPLVAWNIADQLLHLNALKIEIERLKQENQALEAEEELLKGQHVKIDLLLDSAKGLLMAAQSIDSEARPIKSILTGLEDIGRGTSSLSRPLLELTESDLDGDDLKNISDESFKRIIVAIEPVARAVQQADIHEPIIISEETLFLCKNQGLDSISWIGEIIEAYQELLPQMHEFIHQLKQLKNRKLRVLEHAADFFNAHEELLKRATDLRIEALQNWLPTARTASLTDGELFTSSAGVVERSL